MKKYHLLVYERYSKDLLDFYYYVSSSFILCLLAHNLKPNLLQLLGYLALLPAIGFSFIYLTNIRKSGAETFGKKYGGIH